MTLKGKITVSYKKKSAYGRYFVTNTGLITSTTMWNKLRSSLFQNTEYDIDIVSCHQSIILGILDALHLDLPIETFK